MRFSLKLLSLLLSIYQTTYLTQELHPDFYQTRAYYEGGKGRCPQHDKVQPEVYWSFGSSINDPIMKALWYNMDKAYHDRIYNELSSMFSYFRMAFFQHRVGPRYNCPEYPRRYLWTEGQCLCYSKRWAKLVHPPQWSTPNNEFLYLAPYDYTIGFTQKGRYKIFHYPYGLQLLSIQECFTYRKVWEELPPQRAPRIFVLYTDLLAYHTRDSIYISERYKSSIIQYINFARRMNERHIKLVVITNKIHYRGWEKVLLSLVNLPSTIRLVDFDMATAIYESILELSCSQRFSHTPVYLVRSYKHLETPFFRTADFWKRNRIRLNLNMRFMSDSTDYQQFWRKFLLGDYKLSSLLALLYGRYDVMTALLYSKKSKGYRLQMSPNRLLNGEYLQEELEIERTSLDAPYLSGELLDSYENLHKSVDQSSINSIPIMFFMGFKFPDYLYEPPINWTHIYPFVPYNTTKYLESLVDYNAYTILLTDDYNASSISDDPLSLKTFPRHDYTILKLKNYPQKQGISRFVRTTEYLPYNLTRDIIKSIDIRVQLHDMLLAENMEYESIRDTPPQESSPRIRLTMLIPASPTPWQHYYLMRLFSLNAQYLKTIISKMYEQPNILIGSIRYGIHKYTKDSNGNYIRMRPYCYLGTVKNYQECKNLLHQYVSWKDLKFHQVQTDFLETIATCHDSAISLNTNNKNIYVGFVDQLPPLMTRRTEKSQKYIIDGFLTALTEFKKAHTRSNKPKVLLLAKSTYFVKWKDIFNQLKGQIHVEELPTYRSVGLSLQRGISALTS